MRDILLNVCSAKKASQTKQEKLPAVAVGRQGIAPVTPSGRICHAPCRLPSLPLSVPHLVCSCLASCGTPPYRRHLRSCPFFVVVRRHSRPTLMLRMPTLRSCASPVLLADTAVRSCLRAAHSRPSRPGSYGAVGGGWSGSFSRRASSFIHLPCHYRMCKNYRAMQLCP